MTALQPVHGPGVGIGQLFVSVGTDYHRFDRLIWWLDEWLATEPLVENVIVQRGTSVDSALANTSLDYIGRSELVAHFQNASVVVCHGGPATILECRSNGLVPIVVPREARFDEHVNDHQVDFCERLSEHNDIQLARTKSEFFRLLDLAVDRGAPAVAFDDGHTTESIERFEQAMVALLGERARSAPFHHLAEVVPMRDSTPLVPVLYIGSVPRSGSTIISELLNEHPHIVNVGEIVHLWERGLLADNLCACGEKFSVCEFWSKVGEVAFGGWENLSGSRMNHLKNRADRTRYIPALLSRRQVPFIGPSIRQYGDIVTRILRAATEVSGAPIIVDTSKHVSTALLLHRMPGVDVRVLHLVRDPRGVAHSWSKRVNRPEDSTDDSEMDRLNAGRVGLRWLWFNWAFANMSRLGMAVQTIRYEDFVADAPGILDRIFEFADLDSNSADLFDDTPLTLSNGHSVAGNPRRLDRRPVEIRPDDAWKTELDAKRKRIVSAVTRPMRSRYRYDRDS